MYIKGENSDFVMWCFQRVIQVLSVMHDVNDWSLNCNCYSREQHPMKTVGKIEVETETTLNFEGWIHFWLDGQSFTVIGTHLPSWIWICLTWSWWKYGFKIVISHFVHRVTCSVHVDRGTEYIQRIATWTCVEPSSRMPETTGVIRIATN